MIDENGKMLTLEQLSEKYSIAIPFTQYYGLLRAIPFKWLDWLQKEGGGPPFKHWYDTLNKAKNKVGIAYWNLNYDDILLRETIQKWAKEGEDYINFEEDEILALVCNIYKITNYVKARSFQYRFLMKSLITNVHLAKFKIKSFNLCTLCNASKETLRHLFAECVIIKRFWTEVF